MPALAFGSHYSVFKERPGTHLSPGVGAGLPKDRSGQIAPLESFLRLPEDPGRPLGGTNTLPDRHGTVNAPHRPTAAGPGPGPAPRTIVPGSPPALADGIQWSGSGPEALHRDPPGGWKLRIPCPWRPRREVWLDTDWWHAVSHPGPPHATRCSKPNGLSAPSPRHWGLEACAAC